MRILLALSLALLFPAAMSGCVVHAHGHHRGRAAGFAADHMHDAHCGHYYCDGAWYHDHGHVHRHGCGHVYVGGIWRIELSP